MQLTNEVVLGRIRTVIDPEVGLNIVDMGLVYDVKIEGARIVIQMTLTTSGCPMGDYLTSEVKSAVLALGNVGEVDVQIVWDPPWSPEKINKEAMESEGQ